MLNLVKSSQVNDVEETNVSATRLQARGLSSARRSSNLHDGRKTFNISKCSVFIRSKTGILNFATFKYYLLRFRKTILH